MLEFDKTTIEKLNNSRIKTEDKLYLIIRHIEEKYGFKIQPNYWEDAFFSLENEERAFYKTWLWLCYAEWESLVAPISEFDKVFGIDKRDKLLSHLNNEKNDSEDLESYYTLNGKAGRILLSWGLEKLKTTYNTM